MLVAIPPCVPDRAHQLMTGAPRFPGEREVPLATWQDPPFNRWAFQHVRELIPTARISRGAGPADQLPTATQDLSGITFRSADQDPTVGDMLASTYTDGFLVLHRRAIVCQLSSYTLTPAT